ncbi:MAG: hypothetical protein MZU97_15290 [Bacillus subtilis]|nr:hypothetical protein [Bacillus subtilis]
MKERKFSRIRFKTSVKFRMCANWKSKSNTKRISLCSSTLTHHPAIEEVLIDQLVIRIKTRDIDIARSVVSELIYKEHILVKNPSERSIVGGHLLKAVNHHA